MDPNITIVTAFFNLGRGEDPRLMQWQRRPVEHYLYFFDILASIKNDMVIYTQSDLVDVITTIRKNHGNGNTTKVIVYNEFDKYKDILVDMERVMALDSFKADILDTQLVQYWSAPYNLVNYLKSKFVSLAIEGGHVKNDQAAWIDFGYCRKPDTIPPSKLWNCNLSKDKIHLFHIDDLDNKMPIEQQIKTNQVNVQGCHIVAGNNMWPVLHNMVMEEVRVLLQQDLIDQDQTILELCYYNHPELFELHWVDKSDWFIIFKKFNELA